MTGGREKNRYWIVGGLDKNWRCNYTKQAVMYCLNSNN